MATPDTFAPPRAPAAADGLPPQSREAEMAVLGSMLVEKESLLKALDLLREEDFYDETHRRVFSAVRALHDRNVTADVVTVGDELERTGGGAARPFLFDLTNLVPSALHVEHYARIVREKSLLRHMIAIAREVAAESHAPQDDAQTLLDRAQQKFFILAQARATKGMTSAGTLMQTAVTTLEKMAESNKLMTGVPTGFDNVFAHLQRYPEIDAEQLERARPELILLSSEPYPFAEKHIAEYRDICPHAQVLLVDGEAFSWYGSRMRQSFGYFRELRLQMGF